MASSALRLEDEYESSLSLCDSVDKVSLNYEHSEGRNPHLPAAVQTGHLEGKGEALKKIPESANECDTFSASDTVSAFHLFTQLPAEIRDLIWAFAVANLPSDSRIIEPYTEDSTICRIDPRHSTWMCPEVNGRRTCRYPLTGQFFDRNSFNSLPALLSVCRASREICLQLFDYCFAVTPGDPLGEEGAQSLLDIPPRCRVSTPGILFRPSRDTIYLASADNGLCKILGNALPHELKTSNIMSLAIEDDLIYDNGVRDALLVGISGHPPLLQGMKEFILVIGNDGDIVDEDEEQVSREYLDSQIPLWEEAFEQFGLIPPHPKIVLMTRDCPPEKNAELWKYVLSSARYKDNQNDARYLDRVLRIHKRHSPRVPVGLEEE